MPRLSTYGIDRPLADMESFQSDRCLHSMLLSLIMIQEIVIGLIFLAALGFIARLIVRSFQAKYACSSGCGKCAVADLKKVENPNHLPS